MAVVESLTSSNMINSFRAASEKEQLIASPDMSDNLTSLSKPASRKHRCTLAFIPYDILIISGIQH